MHAALIPFHTVREYTVYRNWLPDRIANLRYVLRLELMSPDERMRLVAGTRIIALFWVRLSKRI